MGTDKAYTPQGSVPRWLLHSGLAEVIGASAWWTLLALVMTESRLIRLDSERWGAKEFCGWFAVRLQKELVPTTGLSKSTVTRAMRDLEDWWLIEIQAGGKAGDSQGRGMPTRVRFVRKTVERLSWLVLPRLPSYLGGVKDESNTPPFVHIWIAADAEGYSVGYSSEQVARMQVETERQPQLSACLVRDALGPGPRKKAAAPPGPEPEPKPKRKRTPKPPDYSVAYEVVQAAWEATSRGDKPLDIGPRRLKQVYESVNKHLLAKGREPVLREWMVHLQTHPLTEAPPDDPAKCMDWLAFAIFDAAEKPETWRTGRVAV